LQEGGPEFRDQVAARQILSNNDNAVTLERVSFQTDLCGELHKIACPVLVIYGENDSPFAAGAGLLRSGITHASTLHFAGVGHHPLVEEHAGTIRGIAAALDSA
jgi:pimeloyl-ACP methyl ester carboxylesterase